jgi:hypothetical protein
MHEILFATAGLRFAALLALTVCLEWRGHGPAPGYVRGGVTTSLRVWTPNDPPGSAGAARSR